MMLNKTESGKLPGSSWVPCNDAAADLVVPSSLLQ